MGWAWEGKEETVGARSGSSFPSQIAFKKLTWIFPLTRDTVAPPEYRRREHESPKALRASAGEGVTSVNFP